MSTLTALNTSTATTTARSASPKRFKIDPPKARAKPRTSPALIARPRTGPGFETFIRMSEQAGAIGLADFVAHFGRWKRYVGTPKLWTPAQVATAFLAACSCTYVSFPGKLEAKAERAAERAKAKAAAKREFDANPDWQPDQWSCVAIELERAARAAPVPTNGAELLEWLHDREREGSVGLEAYVRQYDAIVFEDSPMSAWNKDQRTRAIRAAHRYISATARAAASIARKLALTEPDPCTGAELAAWVQARAAQSGPGVVTFLTRYAELRHWKGPVAAWPASRIPEALAAIRTAIYHGRCYGENALDYPGGPERLAQAYANGSPAARRSA